MAHTTHWEASGCVTEFRDDVPMAEIETVNNDLYNDPRFDAMKYMLWDMSRVTAFGATLDDARQAAYQNLVGATYKPMLRIAYVQTPDPEINDVLAFYISFSREIGNRWEQRLFASLADARGWIAALR